MGEVNISISVSDETFTESGVELCFIKESCTHAVQYGGLCKQRGKESRTRRIIRDIIEDRGKLFHVSGLKISLDEATKIENNTTDRLVGRRSLILVVD